MRRATPLQLPPRISIAGRVLSHPRYAFIAIVAALTILAFALSLPKAAILRFIVTFPGYSLSDRWSFFFSTLFSFQFFPTVLSKITVVALSSLTGLYASLLWYFLAHRIASYRVGGLGASGIILGLIGIGCTACGSVVLVSLVGLSLAGAILGSLPFKGAEISIVGLLILLASIYFISGKIRDPLVCKI